MIDPSHPFKAMFYHVPSVIKKTILATLSVTFFSVICHTLFIKIFHIHSPESLLSLSVWGMHRLFIWQIVSYLFLYPISHGGVSIGLVFQIFFNLSLLWTIGSAIVQTCGKRHFIGLYFGGGFFIGLIAYLLLLLLQVPVFFAGPTRSIHILLIGWAFLFPKAPISLFFFIPMSAKSIVFGFIGIHLLLDFSNGEFFSFFVTAAALLYGYFYSLLIWNRLSPFIRFHAMEKKMIAIKRKLAFHFFKLFGHKSRLSKVYSFKTGKIILERGECVNVFVEKRDQKTKGHLTLWKQSWIWRALKKMI